MVHKKDTRQKDLFGSQEYKLKPNLQFLEVKTGQSGRQLNEIQTLAQQDDNFTPRIFSPMGDFVCVCYMEILSLLQLRNLGLRKCGECDCKGVRR